MNDKVTQVADRPAELWIKVLGLVAIVTLPLISVIGTLIIDKVNETNIQLGKINDTINIFSVALENHNGRISRVERDIKQVITIQNDYGKRIYKIEGVRHGQ